MEPEEDLSSTGQDFNLDSYRDLLERLQYSKRRKATLDKQAPVDLPAQLA